MTRRSSVRRPAGRHGPQARGAVAGGDEPVDRVGRPAGRGRRGDRRASRARTPSAVATRTRSLAASDRLCGPVSSLGRPRRRRRRRVASGRCLPGGIVNAGSACRRAWTSRLSSALAGHDRRAPVPALHQRLPRVDPEPAAGLLAAVAGEAGLQPGPAGSRPRIVPRLRRSAAGARAASPAASQAGTRAAQMISSGLTCSSMPRASFPDAAGPALRTLPPQPIIAMFETCSTDFFGDGHGYANRSLG